MSYTEPKGSRTTYLTAPVTGGATDRRAVIAHVLPFAVFVGVMALERGLSIPWQWVYPTRALATLAVLLAYSRPWIPLRPSRPLASFLLGVAVFIIWIAPDLLFHYRTSVLFQNPLTGSAATTFPAKFTANIPILLLRSAVATLLVPIIEELFWRSWLMRYLIDVNFLSVPLGTYARGAFWITAVLFASEHGAYWEVGLAAGIIYNWWLIRTRDLADCILAHAVTNGVLCVYIISGGHWQYWL